ncbi:MAG: hypothetical protein WCS42_13095 [Verrucomicrobiota bacterium]
MKRSNHNAHSNNPLNKAEIKAALHNAAFPNGLSPKLKNGERIFSAWQQWKSEAEWIKKNPNQAAKSVGMEDGKPLESILEAHQEKTMCLHHETAGLCASALIACDAVFFREISAAISKQARAAAKSRFKPRSFNLRDFMLLKEADSGVENVLKLAKHLKDSGSAQQSESVESIALDLRRRRRKLRLKKLSR